MLSLTEDQEDELLSRLIWPVAATLGEGPAWIADDAALWFVDIKQGALHRYDPATGHGSTVAVGGRPSFVLPTDDGGLIVGSGDGLHIVRDGTLGDPVATIDMPAHNRTNDAAVDPSGRLWFGTMDDGETKVTGAVHLFDGGTITVAGGESIITNGPAISPDGRFLYHVDTVAGVITRFDIAATDRLLDGEPFVTIAPEDGHPDGASIDSEGCVWVALWGGWQVRRYGPDGTLLATVAFPCANVTKVAFGGPDLRTAFVTTARAGLSDVELAAQPLAGGLFAFDAPVPGIPITPVRIAR
ncbi:SMP-30/gluconolactonase/LRE family protein [Sphingomonas bacterium]|uniref:SMP-30/gluconolactonase/LRE family protein n=1 Tax=Sphingomonas bacterium TaxID=1895847 RepID=UPI0020C6BC87|nr:SMP-30/gluconolactonase/LRE family protein [Sphingomonas bacterium]